MIEMVVGKRWKEMVMNRRRCCERMRMREEREKEECRWARRGD